MFSCSGSFTSDTKIGVKHINGLKIQATILSADRFVKPGTEMYNYYDDGRDNLKKSYPDNIIVLLAISPDETIATNQDVAWKGISAYNEYKQRMHYLNFQIRNDVSLRIGEKKFKPVLSHLESGHELKQSRNILFVFSPNEPEDAELFRTARLLELEYKDRVFDAGITHFRLARDDYKN